MSDAASDVAVGAVKERTSIPGPIPLPLLGAHLVAELRGGLEVVLP